MNTDEKLIKKEGNESARRVRFLARDHFRLRQKPPAADRA
jgi:hypothetical protein